MNSIFHFVVKDPGGTSQPNQLQSVLYVGAGISAVVFLIVAGLGIRKVVRKASEKRQTRGSTGNDSSACEGTLHPNNIYQMKNIVDRYTGKIIPSPVKFGRCLFSLPNVLLLNSENIECTRRVGQNTSKI